MSKKDTHLTQTGAEVQKILDEAQRVYIGSPNAVEHPDEGDICIVPAHDGVAADAFEYRNGAWVSRGSIDQAIARAISAYQKPDTGIPASDLAIGVQTSLEKADAAMPGITALPSPIVSSGDSLAKYVSTHLNDTGIYYFVWVGPLSDEDTATNAGLAYVFVFENESQSTVRLVLFGGTTASNLYAVTRSLSNVYSLEKFATMEDIPTNVSELVNDVGFITSSVDNLVNYYLKSETYTKDEVTSLIGAIQQFHYEIYASTSAVSDPQGNVLYLIGPTGSGSDRYEEYVYANNTWTKIGDTSIDLSGYVTTTALNTALANYTSTADLNTLLAGKQDTISDLSTIRSGASAGATAYQKPAGGIPKTDMASGVQTSLGKADSALQPGDAPLIFDPVSCGDDFVYRQSPATGDGTASIEQVRGKSLVWNQKANGSFASNQQTKLSYDASTQTYTVLEIVSDYTSAYYALGNVGVTGHKYYFRMRLTPSSDCSVKWSTGGYATNANSRTYQLYAGKTNALTRIESVTNSYQWFGVVEGTVGQTIHADGFDFIDLTLMYGAGNEPSSVEEFQAMFPLPYYAYNAGEIISNKTEEVKVVGFNQWDEEWEVGNIAISTGQNDVNASHGRSKNYIPCFPSTEYFYRTTLSTWASFRYYDAGKNFLGSATNLGVNKNTTFTTPVNAYYMRFVLQNAVKPSGICINLSDSSRNGTYEPYKKSILPLNISTLTGKLNGEGESVIICSDGLKSAGSAYDYGIIENGYLTKIVKVIGEVDMGTLTWEKGSSGDRFAAQGVATTPGFDHAYKGGKSNLTCVLYIAGNAATTSSGYASNNPDKSIGLYYNGAGMTPRCYFIKDSSSFSQYDAEEFKQHLSGVMLYYERVTPQTYVLDTPIPATFQSYKGGTEQRLPEDTASVVNAPFAGMLRYYTLGKETKETLDANYATKGEIPAAQIQSDWNQVDTSAKDFIKNKPTIPSNYAGSPSTGGPANKTFGIPFGAVDSTSTSTAFTATVDNFPTTLVDGVCAYVRNDVVSSAEGYTLNINGTGDLPVYSSIADATRDKTIFTAARTFLFIYNSSRVDGGCWDLYYGMYVSDTDVIGQNIRGQFTLPVKYKTYRYRMLFESPDGTLFIPANKSTSTSATSAKAVVQDEINPFGLICYYSYTTAINADAVPSTSYVYTQYLVTLGYSFNTTGSALTLTVNTPVYLKCAPQANGMAIIDENTPFVQTLPTTKDGKIYIFLGIAKTETELAMLVQHPIYYHDGTDIRLWTGVIPVPEDKLVVLTANAYEALSPKDPDTFYFTYEE